MSRYYRRITAMALAGLLVGAAGGCDNFLDVNQNPNAPEFVRFELTLPSIIMYNNAQVAEERLNHWTSQWVQQWSWNRETYPYSQRHRYEMTAIDADTPWNTLWTTTANECKNLINATKELEAPYFSGIAKLILAWKGAQLTDAWGSIPWSDALNPSKRDPVYDTQQEVYASVHTLVEEAIAEMSKPQTPTMQLPGARDLLYGGNMAQWVKLAHTLQARLHVRLVYAPGENPQQRAQAALDALAKGYASRADEARIQFVGGSGSRQPLYGSWVSGYGNGAWNHQVRASDFFIEILKETNDPRLPVMFDPALYDGEFRGVPGGGPSERDSLISGVGRAIWEETVPLRWITFAEAKFLEAEARLIVSGPAAADAPYRAGIRAHMEMLGEISSVAAEPVDLPRVPEAEIDAYLAALPSLASLQRPLEAIITQKYISNFALQGMEAWNDWRRTGYPVMEPVPVDREPFIPEIPQRLRTPSTESDRNTQNVLATGVPTDLAGMLRKVWWASGTPTVQ